MDKSKQVQSALKEAISHIAKTIEKQKANENNDEVLLQATKQLSDLIDIISARLLQEIKDKANTEEHQTLLKALTVLRDQTLTALEKWNASGMPFLEHNFKGLAELTQYEVKQIRTKAEEKKIDLNLNGNELFKLIVKSEEEKENPLSQRRALRKDRMSALISDRKDAELRKINEIMKEEKNRMLRMMQKQKQDLHRQRNALEDRVRQSEMKLMDLLEMKMMHEQQMKDKQECICKLKEKIEQLHYQAAKK